MRSCHLAVAVLLAAGAVAAHAGYTTIDYTGTVTRVYPADGGPTAPADIFVGQTASFAITVDLSKLITFAPFILPNGTTGAPMLVHPKGVTLDDDPLASYTVTIGSHVWTQADETSADEGYFTPTGIGPNPMLAYDGVPSQLLGLSNDAVNAEGLELYSNPADFFAQYDRYPVYGGSIADGGFGFALNTSLDAEILDLREQALAAGQLPEPGTAALLMLGAVGLVAASRPKAGAARVGFAFMA